jgi:hypothetical protein
MCSVVVVPGMKASSKRAKIYKRLHHDKTREASLQIRQMISLGM